MEEICGYIERITYQNPENGYTVAQLKEARRQELTCIVGSMPDLKPGETIRCQGVWKNHLVYGRQFIVSSHRIEAPADLIGIKKYLGSGLIKGIGHKYANRIVEKFATSTLEIIDKTPERLLEVEGMGKKRVEKIRECWEEQKSIRDVMIFLQGHGVSPAYAQKVYKNYGAKSIQKVKENPFQMARDIYGIGFRTADEIAQKLGIPKDSPGRIQAGIENMLSEQSDEGHVCFPFEELMKITSEILEIDRSAIEMQIESLLDERRIEVHEIVNEGKVEKFAWLRPFFLAELGIGKQISRILNERCHLRDIDIPKAIEWVQTKLNLKLADNQRQAVAQAMHAKMQIITGGPGTGKSTITNAILSITEKLTHRIVLAAPTGRAAKRMTEITGKKASTIHSLLEFDFQTGKFKKNLENPIECDLIIIDESSMIDTLLMNNLLKAIPSHARVIFVGDIYQLPSVGPGNVLKDIIQSHRIPVTVLNEIFRQAAGSRIITNAHKINNGTFPEISPLSNSDFYFIEAEEPEDVLRNILSLVTQRLPLKFNYNPFQEIQVLAPMKRGIVGIDNLNHELQQLLNPKGSILTWGGKRLLTGDKVMQIRNDHKKCVYNGDIGIIQSIDPEEQELVILFDDRPVVYAFSDLDEITLAYAVSIHKYQGSECPCIVMPVHTTHFKLLHRNLLYTGVTRGKKLVVLVGTKKAIAIAVKNDEVKRRYTGLRHALAGAFDSSLLKSI